MLTVQNHVTVANVKSVTANTVTNNKYVYNFRR